MHKKLFVTHEQLVHYCFDLAQRIARRDRSVTTIVALGRGGSTAGIIIHEMLEALLQKQLRYLPLECRNKQIEPRIAFMLSKLITSTEHVVIVDDIFDSGDTMKTAVSIMLSTQCCVSTATVYYRPTLRHDGMVPQYYAAIVTDEWVVFPHELDPQGFIAKLGPKYEEVCSHMFPKKIVRPIQPPSRRIKAPKIVVTGYARHGKDTFCDYLTNFAVCSSSMLLCHEIVMPAIGDFYDGDAVQCYDDRVNHRELWYTLTVQYNRNDPARFSRKLFETNDVYCGLRSAAEFAAAKKEGLIDLAVWIDASKRLPPEGKESMSLTQSMCDVVVDNNGTLEEFVTRARAFNDLFKRM